MPDECTTPAQIRDGIVLAASAASLQASWLRHVATCHSAGQLSRAQAHAAALALYRARRHLREAEALLSTYHRPQESASHA